VTAPDVQTVRLADPGGWATLRAAVRSREPGGALLVDGATGGRLDDDAAGTLPRLARAPRPVVVLLGGTWDAAGLALLLTGTVGYVLDDLAVELDDVGALLTLGLAGELQRAIGPVAARRLLLDARRLDATTAVRLGLARAAADADPAATAARLARDGGARLLLRSLAAAARSTPDQARLYDTELRHLAGA
jgi:enoyl-CoA hydratase/carnithine racemase